MTKFRVSVPLHGIPIEAGVAEPTATLTYGNGHLLTAVKVYTIFWGAAWGNSPQNGLVPKVNQFFDFILTSTLLDLLSEYDTSNQKIGHGTRIGTNTITTSEPGGTTNMINDNQIQQTLQGWINDGTIPQPTDNTLYFVYMPPGVTVIDPSNDVSCVAMCGYHWFIANSNPTVYYAVMPFPNCSPCSGSLALFDALTSTSSHELCEAITDPHPWTGWNDSVHGEIGDICSWQTQSLGGFIVQKEWSNNWNACLVGTPWTSLGGVLTSDPVAIQNADGRIEVFVKGSDNALHHIWQTTPNGPYWI